MTKIEWQVLGFVFCLMIVLTNVVAHVVWYPKREFDRTVWLDPSPAQMRKRQQMADWLLGQNQLLGQPKADVIERLGKPSQEEIFNNWNLAYWLGRERTLVGVDSEWLVMRVGKDDRVTEARIVRR